MWQAPLNAASDATFTGLALWILYLALEPTVRSRWPQALVTWNRLLAGQFADAQLGAHILTGAAVGLLLLILLGVLGWSDYRSTGMPFNNSLDGSESTLSWLGTNAQTLQGALATGFIVFFTIFGFRALWKNDYAAAFSTAVLFAFIANDGLWNHSNPLTEGLLLLAIFAVLALILIRMGMVSSVATIFFINTPNRINLGPGLSGWYTPYGIATLALLMAIAVGAFWQSIGARTLAEEDR